MREDNPSGRRKFNLIGVLTAATVILTLEFMIVGGWIGRYQSVAIGLASDAQDWIRRHFGRELKGYDATKTLVPQSDH